MQEKDIIIGWILELYERASATKYHIRRAQAETTIFVKSTVIGLRTAPTFGSTQSGSAVGHRHTVYPRIIPELQILLSGNEGENGEGLED